MCFEVRKLLTLDRQCQHQLGVDSIKWFKFGIKQSLDVQIPQVERFLLFKSYSN